MQKNYPSQTLVRPSSRFHSRSVKGSTQSELRSGAGARVAMIRAAALLAIASVAALSLNETTVDKHLLKRLSTYLDSNKTIDIDKLRNLNKTVLLNKELVTILNNYVNEQNQSKPTNSKVSDEVESYNVYENGKMGSTLVESIEESPDYASSIVLASDVLSLTSAVANVEDQTCREQGYRFLDGLLQNKRWALKSKYPFYCTFICTSLLSRQF